MFKSTSGGMILDPCAGEGAALEALASQLVLKPFANEIDRDRYAECVKRFGIAQTACGDMFQLRTPHGAFSIAWVNPPYTENLGRAAERRREFEMLKEAWKWIQYGGYCCWIVYSTHMTERAAKFLVENSTSVDVWRVPGMHLDTHVQIVVVARVGLKNEVDVTDDRVISLVENCKQPDTLRQLEVLLEPIYKLPGTAKVRRFYFHTKEITPDVMLPALQQMGAQLLPGLRSIGATPPPPPPLTPVVPPRSGQTGLLLAAGLFDGLILRLETGPAAVRGVVRMVEIETTEPGMKGVRETFEHKAQVTITLLSRSGKVRLIEGKDTDQLVTFIKHHQAAFIRYLEDNSTPIYNFDYSELEDVFARVFRNRKLAGRPSTGLFETQKHIVGAAYATLLHRAQIQGRGNVILVSDMGTGKSVMGAALIGALHARGQFRKGQIAVVMCPGHLVRKWVAEFNDAVPGSRPRIVENVDEVVAFMKEVDKRPDKLHVMVLSKERAKLGEGWAPAYVTKRERITLWPYNSKPPREYLDKEGNLRPGVERIVIREILICPQCGQPIYSTKDRKSPASLSWLKRQRRKCSYEYPDGTPCGAALWSLKRTFSNPKAGQKFPERNPRYPVAQFLRDRYPDRIGAFAADELHELKGESSDQGRAMQTLVKLANYSIGLTGTLFGGVASSVFWLEFAFNPRMYSRFSIDEDHGGPTIAVRNWVRTMGVLERVITYDDDKADSGAYSGISRIEHAPKEVPGISPSLVAELIDHAIWCSLQDLAFTLPPYVEIPIAVDLPPDVQAHYDHEKKMMLDYLIGCKNEGDASFLGAYLQSALRYPTACFRDRQVIHRSKTVLDPDGNPLPRVVTVLKGFGEQRIYPKEEALIETLQDELGQGRPCAIYVCQTGTLDIQPRLKEIIEKYVPGARIAVLRTTTCDTDARDEWLKEQVEKGCNILICNPRLVQTGLDLLDFKSLIFLESDFSLYVTSQASRRSWRIGQTEECRVYYFYYNNTMEAQAIELISAKQAAASLLSGDAEGGGLAQLSGGATSLEAELAKSIASSNMVVDATQLFQQKARASSDFTSGWATGAEATAEIIEVIPLENVIGQRYYAQSHAHEVVDYGPLDHAGYVVRRLSDASEILLPAKAVLSSLKRFPASEDAPIVVGPRHVETPQPSTPAQLPQPQPIAGNATSQHYRRYLAAKDKMPHRLVLMRLGHFYEAFGDDAKRLSDCLDIVLTSRMLGPDQRVMMAGVPAHALDRYVKQLLKQGIEVAVLNPANQQTPKAPDVKLPEVKQPAKEEPTPVKPFASKPERPTFPARRPAPQKPTHRRPATRKRPAIDNPAPEAIQLALFG